MKKSFLKEKLCYFLVLSFLAIGVPLTAGNAALSALEVSSGTENLIENFSSENYAYEVPAGTSRVNVSVVPSTSDATVDIVAGSVTFQNPSAVDMTALESFRVTVTAGSDVRTYTIEKEKVKLSSNFNEIITYQVMVESYQNGDPNRNYGTGYGPSHHNGDIKGITNALPYIKSLGANAVWLTPVFDSDGGSQLDATGYFCRDYFAIDPKFGSLDDAREMVNKAHELGMYVFFDGVFGHHKGNVKASPTGKYPTGSSNPVSYPGSLAFYQEVATYWIETLEIDGWRLDQSYQVYQNGHNYWKEIREAVEAACNKRKAEGKTWGTLGYMVGEDWNGEQLIQNQTYGGEGLMSAFDFPARYRIVQSIATEESRNISGMPAGNLAWVFQEPAGKGYSHPKGVYPNLFLTNHDLVRLGNLIQWKYNINRTGADYWKRHKIAISTLAAYTGPITLYYGDEYGDMLDGYTGSGSMGYYDDHVARSSGRISGFSSTEQDLVNYTSRLMKIRSENPALFDGTYINLFSDTNRYGFCKVKDNNKVVYLLNIGTSDASYSISQSAVGGSKLVNLEDNSTIPVSGGNYSITLNGLSAGFYKVE